LYYQDLHVRDRRSTRQDRRLALREASIKTLYLLRHGKSDWSDPRLEDFDRPLATRGQRAGRLVGRAMRDMGLVPTVVLCSAARRAQETWELVRPILGGRSRVRVLRSLYLATPSRLLAAVQRLPAEAPSALLIGHNPGLAGLARLLSGPDSKTGALTRLGEKYPTGALAELRFDVADWASLAAGKGRLLRFLRPRDLQ